MADPNPPTSGTTSPMTSAVSALRGKEGNWPDKQIAYWWELLQPMKVRQIAKSRRQALLDERLAGSTLSALARKYQVNVTRIKQLVDRAKVERSIECAKN